MSAIDVDADVEEAGSSDSSSRSSDSGSRSVEQSAEGYNQSEGLYNASDYEQPSCLGFEGSDSEVRPVRSLLEFVVTRYFIKCAIVVLYDGYYESRQRWIIDFFLRSASLPVKHAPLSDSAAVARVTLPAPDGRCQDYALLIRLAEEADGVLPERLPAHSRVVVVTQSDHKGVRVFFRQSVARNLLHVLVAADRPKQLRLRKRGLRRYPDINLYGHRLFPGGGELSAPVLLTAWRCTRLTRPATDLFPPALYRGFSGHSFRVALGVQPPYVFRRRRGGLVPALRETPPRRDADEALAGGAELGDLQQWDGLEVRLMEVMAEALNFSIDFRAVLGNDTHDAADGAVDALERGTADLAAGGVYVSPERVLRAGFTGPHMQDCATFISLTSTALPRYRAIMGPFHWSVWLALTFTYVLAIFPIAFSHSHSLTYLLTNPGQAENMFWYVFGTFTNCFTFRGKDSWSATDKNATRLLIGSYWAFTIMVTACYTGSIIAFVTLPMFPQVVDSSRQIHDRRFRVATLGVHGWKTWFQNSSDPIADELMRRMEYVPTVLEGLHNVTHSWHAYAFLGSRAYMEYLVKQNYTRVGQRSSRFHVSAECFVPFGVGLAYRRDAVYSEAVNRMLLRASQSGIVPKVARDVEWQIQRTGVSGQLQAAVVSSVRALRTEDKKLSLDDTQGTFLLLGAGFAIAFFALFVECLLACVKRCAAKCAGAALSPGSAEAPSGFAVTPGHTPEIVYSYASGGGGGGGGGGTPWPGGEPDEWFLQTEAVLLGASNFRRLSSHSGASLVIRRICQKAELRETHST